MNISNRKNLLFIDSISIAHTLVTIGNVLKMQNDDGKALDYYQQASEIYVKRNKSDHINHGNCLYNWTEILYKQRKYEESFESFKKALRIRRKFYEDDSNYVACTFNYVAHIYFGQERYVDSINFYQESLYIYEKNISSDEKSIAILRANIGDALQLKEDNEEAIKFYEHALAIYETNHSSYSLNIEGLIEKIGMIKLIQRKFAEYATYYKRLISLLKEYDSTNMNIASYLYQIANVYLQNNEINNAITYLNKCLRFSEVYCSSKDYVLTETLSTLAEIHSDGDEVELSLSYELNKVLLCEKFLSPSSVDMGRCFSKIGKCYERLNQPKLAIVYYKRALSIYEKCFFCLNEDIFILGSDIHRLEQELNN